MTTETAIEVLLWILLAFSLIICVLEVICVVLYKRLKDTRRLVSSSHSSRPNISANIPITKEMKSTIGKICLSKTAGSVSLKGGSPIIADTKIPVTIPNTMKAIIATILFIQRVYKALRCYVNQIREESVLHITVHIEIDTKP